MFMKDNKGIGSITPSSKYLVREIITNINFDKAKVIVELGMGTGVITKELIKNCSINTKIIGFETNQEMHDYVLNRLHSNINPIFIKDNSIYLKYYLDKLNIKNVDYFICSLPLLNFNIKTRVNLLKNINSYMNKNSTFIICQYTNNTKFLLKEMFRVIRKKLILLNIPPAIIYVLKKNI